MSEAAINTTTAPNGLDMLIEQKLETMGNQAILYAKSIVIANHEEYEGAADFLTEIKRRAKAVKDYWAEPKSRAKAAHQSVVDKEKAMLDPLSESETIVKRAMVTYQNAVEVARRKAEAEARERQRLEAERLMKEAVAAEEKGDDAKASIAMAMAEMVEDMKAPMPNAVETPKASGISTRKVWKARIINPGLVPIMANGIEIRPINSSAIDQLARMSRGTIEIPGVEFYEDVILSART